MPCAPLGLLPQIVLLTVLMAAPPRRPVPRPARAPSAAELPAAAAAVRPKASAPDVLAGESSSTDAAACSGLRYSVDVLALVLAACARLRASRALYSALCAHLTGSGFRARDLGLRV